MEISAVVRNAPGRHDAAVRTGATEQALAVPPKASAPGSAISGGELLMLALATCYCNDLYREAAGLGLALDAVEVEATADFPGVGLAATNVRYGARVTSGAPPEAIAALLERTDAVAEVQATLRAGVPVVRLA
jgi:organic hydroperoxide reductase OsmC/OhrA